MCIGVYIFEEGCLFFLEGGRISSTYKKDETSKTSKEKRGRERLVDDSLSLITQAAFYFNHINEAFNLTACFTSRRCVAPRLGFVYS